MPSRSCCAQPRLKKCRVMSFWRCGHDSCRVRPAKQPSTSWHVKLTGKHGCWKRAVARMQEGCLVINIYRILSFLMTMQTATETGVPGSWNSELIHDFASTNGLHEGVDARMAYTITAVTSHFVFYAVGACSESSYSGCPSPTRFEVSRLLAEQDRSESSQ